MPLTLPVDAAARAQESPLRREAGSPSCSPLAPKKIESRASLDLTGLLRSRGRTRQNVLKVLDSSVVGFCITSLSVLYAVFGIAAICFDLGLICVKPNNVIDSTESSVRSKSFLSRGSYRGGSGSLAPDGGLMTPEHVLHCDVLYSHWATAAHAISVACLCISAALLLEHLARICCVSPTYYFQHRELRVDLAVLLACIAADLLVLLWLRPLMLEVRSASSEESSSSYNRLEAKLQAGITVLRLLRLLLLLRVARDVRSQLKPGSEVAKTIDVMELLKHDMPNVEIQSVKVVRNSSAELRVFEGRRAQMRELRGRVEEKTLFFCGPSGVDLQAILQSEHGLDKSFARWGVLGCALYGAEHPAYADSCFAFVDSEHGGSPGGHSRQMLVFQALVGETQDLGYDTSSGRSRPDAGFDSVCAGPWTPAEYIPEQLGLECRDVSSIVYALYEPQGQALLTAIISYENPDVQEEVEALEREGYQNWHEYYASRPQYLNWEQAKVLHEFEAAIDSGDAASIAGASARCLKAMVPEDCVAASRAAKKAESEQAGISLAYILSDDFQELARAATGKEDPTFCDMRDPFFLDASRPRIGERHVCPRDGQPGCAYIDTLPKRHRQKATHFMSWVWGYKLSVVRDALGRWAKAKGEDPEKVFLFICFFCNNQWRILVEGSGTGSDDLEVVFAARLSQIGRVVAVMDSWQEPVYLSRIWTIFEQFMATHLGIQMEFTLPGGPASTLLEQLEQGKEGITKVIKEVSAVDAKHAKATFEQDERKVKELIGSTIGFDVVNAHVRSSITAWVAHEFKARIDALVQVEGQR